MIRPVRGRHLVADQAIGGVRVRNPEQRLGEAHQDHAFLARESVFGEEGIDAALAGPPLAHRLDQRPRAFLDPAKRRPIECGGVQQALDGRRLLGPVGRAHRGAQGAGLG